MSTTHKQTITFTIPQTDFLRDEAELLGISVADLVRRIIDEHRARHSNMKMRYQMSAQERFGVDYPGILGSLAAALVDKKIDRLKPFMKGHVLTEEDLRCTPRGEWMKFRLIDPACEAAASVIRQKIHDIDKGKPNSWG